MTKEQIVSRMAKQFPDWKVTDVSFTPWGAYIYAVNEKTNRKHTFTIDF